VDVTQDTPRPANADYAGAVPKERTVTGDGVPLLVREWPGGAPGVLLVHGLASSSHIWDLVAPRLSRTGTRAVAYDQRGHGRSGKPSSGYGFGRTAADAAAVIAATRLGRPNAVGHSWGANVVLELAVRFPRRVAGIVLVDGGFLGLRDRFDWPTARQALAPPNLSGTPLHEFLEMIRYFLRGQVEITPEVEAVFLSLMRVDGSGNIHPRLSRANHLRILRSLWEQDALGLLRRVRVPTLVLAVRSAPGIADSAGFMEEKERAAGVVRAIGDPVRFAWIDGIHDLPLQRPAALAGRILRFASAAP
jgi:pimeloyl-ACP methyl ester carboxylesterase